MATNKIKVDIFTSQDLGYSEESKRHLNTDAASICVRALMQNWRQGTVGCKGRSDVAFSNKKPWKQKGTGRARAGSKRSPLWRGGGVIFGPQERVRTLKITKKVKANVIGSLFEKFADNERILKIHWTLEADRPKTSLAFKVLNDANLIGKKVNMFVNSSDIDIQASFANLPEVRLMYFDECNVYDLANADYIICLEKDADLLKNMVRRWI